MMIPKRKVPAVFATTALMILRNRLSERVWGSYGVNTFPADDPLPHRVGGGRPALDRQRPPGRIASPHTRHGNTSTKRPRTRSRRLGGVGVIGDSISDEYRFYAPDRVTARNWVEVGAIAPNPGIMRLFSGISSPIPSEFAPREASSIASTSDALPTIPRSG
jgi:hypothetical protein